MKFPKFLVPVIASITLLSTISLSSSFILNNYERGNDLTLPLMVSVVTIIGLVFLMYYIFRKMS